MGEANYNSFIYATVFLLLNMMASISLILSHGPNRKRWYVYIPISIDFIAFLLSSELILGHVYFYLKGITTYTHFRFKRLQKEKMLQLKNKKISS